MWISQVQGSLGMLAIQRLGWQLGMNLDLAKIQWKYYPFSHLGYEDGMHPLINNFNINYNYDVLKYPLIKMVHIKISSSTISHYN